MPEVVIVGAGPVGLFVGLLLLQRGHHVRILERRRTRSTRSRAIGVHPPALVHLARAGVADELIDAGVRIREGIAYSQRRDVARLSFSGDANFPFILAVPQPVTEDTLERAVLRLDPSAIIRGADVKEIDDGDAGPVRVLAATESGELDLLAHVVIAADGAHSRLRQSLLPDLPARTYPDSYIMGDYSDHTGHGSSAVLYLEPPGIVESFPLPHGVRRWVVRLGAPDPGSTAAQLADLIADRTGEHVDPASNTMLSAFDVQARLAKRMVHGRMVLLGDAAHEISPIGGQGMNLGWLDAAALAPLMGALLTGDTVQARLDEFEKRRRRAALRASRQAGINMALGRPLPAKAMTARNALFAAALAVPPVATLVERRFTMR
ncbi:NAD(P)/FAD-dependent oxidoreductase [Arthrobacter sp. fls2-241-R2A-200]|uniref:FAD-dependent oxidoreductase n=1 Tax=Arthrobacter sp. fls2-241-R2A-200 TaxID=3040281 RepID=UPI00254D8F13|nr:NAD(P)/FAD-dependent oxidoreductase [Arthrobacter sp. fls2-241-R2A-200]